MLFLFLLFLSIYIVSSHKYLFFPLHSTKKMFDDDHLTSWGFRALELVRLKAKDFVFKNLNGVIIREC